MGLCGLQPGAVAGACFAKSTFIKSNPDTIDCFNDAIKESIVYMTADPDRARAEVVASPGLPASLVKDMPIIGWDYKVRADKWQAVIDMSRT